MPPHFVPTKSGVHRVACLALYRSLVRKGSQLPIGEHQQYALRQVIKNLFRKNRKIQSPSKIVEVLNLGYQSLDTLRYASSGPLRVVSELVERLTGPKLLLKEEDSKHTSQCQLSLESTKRRKNTQVAPIVWPRPNTPLVLSRPFLSISGKRRVPTLVNTNGIPHLRFKKPQSPFLSRIIRNKIVQRQKRFDRSDLLKAEIAIARAEDEWDHILSRTCKIEEDNSVRWAKAHVSARQEVKAKIQASHIKNTALGRKMDNIVEMEKALAEKEQGNVDTSHLSEVGNRRVLSAGCA